MIRRLLRAVARPFREYARQLEYEKYDDDPDRFDEDRSRDVREGAFSPKADRKREGEGEK